MMDSIAEQKFMLRRTLLAERRTLAPPLRAQWDRAIGHAIMRWCLTQRVSVLGVYSAIKGEPDLTACYAQLMQTGVLLALPIVVDPEGPLRYAAWTPGEPCAKDKMGVTIPAELRWLDMPAALLVPCLGFNAARCRLGYGGGYYDRTLAQRPRPATVGVAYACGQVQFVAEAHDIALDLIMTEHGALT